MKEPIRVVVTNNIWGAIDDSPGRAILLWFVVPFLLSLVVFALIAI
jgi:hypothetical protein